MVNRLVSVGDDFNLPASVKAVDANLPARLQDAALSVTYGTPKLDKTEAAATYAGLSDIYMYGAGALTVGVGSPTLGNAGNHQVWQLTDGSVTGVSAGPSLFPPHWQTVDVWLLWVSLTATTAGDVRFNSYVYNTTTGFNSNGSSAASGTGVTESIVASPDQRFVYRWTKVASHLVVDSTTEKLVHVRRLADAGTAADTFAGTIGAAAIKVVRSS